MALPILQNRRQFLERSMLGFSGAFLLPSLLQSCTDHNIPPTNPPITPPNLPPILGEDSFDWNDAAKTAVSTGLSMVPEVGEILAALTEILWPSSGTDVWGQIKDQVEALVDQKIAEDKYDAVKSNLEGLRSALTPYLDAAKKNDLGAVLGYWRPLRVDFNVFYPNFIAPGYELLLLPLIGQFANLYHALLRDAVLYGKSWGMQDEEVQGISTDLTNSIRNFTIYTNTWYNWGLGNVEKATKADKKINEPFTSMNRYTRQMTLTVLDFRDTWPFYDPTVYPDGGFVVPQREIYSDPFGATEYSRNSNPITLPSAPTQFPTNLTVWGFAQIDAVQLTYPAGSGPGGVTTTPRMGDQPDGKGSGGTNQPPHGGVFNLSPTNPIIKAQAIYAVYEYAWNWLVTSMRFQYNDGTLTDLLGGTAPNSNAPSDSGLIGYTNEALSSIYIHGDSKFVTGADCVVFGFMTWQSPAATLNAIKYLYVTSPKERSAADFVKAFPKLSLAADLFTDELKTARKAYWEYIEARAKASK